MLSILLDSLAHLERVSQVPDLGEALLDRHRSLLHALGLSLHQVERVAAFPADGSLQSSNRVLKQRVARFTDTRRVVVVLVVVGKGTPFRTGIDDAITDL